MFKDPLPKDCPPKEASEDEKWLYRILKSETLCDEDFKNYVTLYPEKVQFKTWWEAYSLSLFESREKAIAKAKWNPKIGTFITKISALVCAKTIVSLALVSGQMPSLVSSHVKKSEI